MISLLDLYEQEVSSAHIRPDPLQKNILQGMQRLADDMYQKNSWFNSKKSIKGIYLYGPIGVGKTFLTDLFFQSLKGIKKSRYHFHAFMQQIDADLRSFQGYKNPLKRIAAKMAKNTSLLFLDEFMVDDVADAMILNELLSALFYHRITLVATSNIEPDKLYQKGVQRERFLPAIELIKKNCDVLLLREDIDYRKGKEGERDAYFYPLNEQSTHSMNAQFSQMVAKWQEHVVISIQKRPIKVEKLAPKAIWFEFNEICNMPRCKLDYLEIAKQYGIFFISNVPIFNKEDTIRVLLFIQLIDVLYDRGTLLVISAAGPLSSLYTEGSMLESFQRTLSRLEEMRSKEYIQRHSIATDALNLSM